MANSAAATQQKSNDNALLDAAATVSGKARDSAATLDNDSAFPTENIEALHRSGLLVAPFPARLGGDEIAAGPRAALLLRPILKTIGAGSLPLGRLYEGHVNAIGLVAAYGSSAQLGLLRAEAARGELFGVWAADDANGLRLEAEGQHWRLAGRKILCSGASHITRPLITAKVKNGGVVMAIPKLDDGGRADLSRWTPQGMRATFTGTIDFTDVRVQGDEIIGVEGDYHRQPRFSGGAWRFLAVQLGAVEALHDLLRAHLVTTRRGGDPHQSARFGQATIAAETARLWVENAAEIAETGEPDAAAAYVNLARLAVERAALDLMEIIHRSIGLASFMRPNPIELISRDLATYLRQPGPDRALTSGAEWVLQRDEGIANLWE